MEKIVLIGGGGHCRSVIDVIESQGKYEIAEILDVEEKLGNQILDYKISAKDTDIPDLARKYDNFLITIGQIHSAKIRIKFYKELKRFGANLPVIISPIAHVSKHATVGEGSVIMHGAIVNAAAKIGINNIINTNSVVEHDAFTGSHCHISTGAFLNGEAILGDGSFLGSGARTAQCVEIIKDTVVGASSYVHKNITESGVYIGAPVKKVS
ncbi:NeuD/PglB/VioB family sugar acetyltransferase [Mangrovivirga sp. M17]|uniref:NeuD/PglB/VioB family sugar acetyltransferase n=1 Tax=Mangrovivirga halotolerans TaxID=2993936 RepID=A0ABT3RQ52_9BACT|nr:NeuD/PglB/VioB family sugar acetyltransferase [Mangrovivirga halotolerans]MCX2743392.1 NeuD/PglB/VioB family sugar acetyltransferase [Mangrovivirga halotolerans]